MIKRNLLMMALLIAVSACSSTIESYKQTLKIALVPAPDVEVSLADLRERTVPAVIPTPK